MCCFSAISSEFTDTIITAEDFSRAPYLRSAKRSLTFYLPRIPKGMNQSPCLHLRHTNGKSSLSASAINIPSGCLRDMPLLHSRTSTCHLTPLKLYIPAPLTGMMESSAVTDDATTTSASRSAKRVCVDESKRFPETVLSD